MIPSEELLYKAGSNLSTLCYRTFDWSRRVIVKLLRHLGALSLTVQLNVDLLQILLPFVVQPCKLNSNLGKDAVGVSRSALISLHICFSAIIFGTYTPSVDGGVSCRVLHDHTEAVNNICPG